MTGITDGYYRIRLAAEPSPLVGLDLSTAKPVGPVVTRPEDEIWIINKSGDGKFYLAIDGIGGIEYYVRDAGRNVVGGGRGPLTQWVIKGPDGGPYTIQAPGNNFPPKVWTVDVPYGNKSPVTLEPLRANPQVPENQKWYILRIPPDN